ncbi:hypothetical protein E1176_19360 [Fulvivirga sp. RKSG066]|uniref:hypothetical protein n=1 Tax=Fulvivirga aurantia TaxID=2529383 RepID=UPI0012BC5DF0|nr:hypothetical protein [Fulvivirga aurantia]MTI23197.1 hypothetical protein [Fulvivirga aurantia]
MKNLAYLILMVLFVAVACDDEDFTPPQNFLDSPSFIATASTDSADGGDVVTIDVRVSDAPAGVDSIAVSTTNSLGDVTINSGSIIGQTEGDFDVVVELPLIYEGPFAITVEVYDDQFNVRENEPARKSFTQTLTVELDYKFAAPSFTVDLEDDQLSAGDSTDITITINDVPGGGIERVTASAGGGTVNLDQASIDAVLGESSGVVTGKYIANADPTETGEVDVTVTIGDVTQQRSASASASVLVICASEGNIAGTYSSYASGSIGNGTEYEAISTVITITQINEGQYMVNDLSFGVYPQIYADSPVSGTINVCGNKISDFNVVDGFGDPFTITGMTADPDVINGVIKIEWSNTFGDNGTVELELQ